MRRSPDLHKYLNYFFPFSHAYVWARPRQNVVLRRVRVDVNKKSNTKIFDWWMESELSEKQSPNAIDEAVLARNGGKKCRLIRSIKINEMKVEAIGYRWENVYIRSTSRQPGKKQFRSLIIAVHCKHMWRGGWGTVIPPSGWNDNKKNYSFDFGWVWQVPIGSVHCHTCIEYSSSWLR